MRKSSSHFQDLRSTTSSEGLSNTDRRSLGKRRRAVPPNNLVFLARGPMKARVKLNYLSFQSLSPTAVGWDPLLLLDPAPTKPRTLTLPITTPWRSSKMKGDPSMTKRSGFLDQGPTAPMKTWIALLALSKYPENIGLEQRKEEKWRVLTIQAQETTRSLPLSQMCPSILTDSFHLFLPTLHYYLFQSFLKRLCSASSLICYGRLKRI